MLKVEDLKKIETLKALDDATLKAIEAASAADENIVIAAKTSEIYGGIDNDITTILGETKPANTKTFDWVKQIATKAKASGDTETLKTQLTEKDAEIETLKTQIKDGKGDEALKTQLAEKERQYNDLKKQFDDTTNDLNEKIKTANETHENYRIDSEFTLPTGTKFKEGLDQTVIDTFVEAARTKARSKGTPVFENVNGKQVLTFRDENNQRLNNPDNQNNPFTAQELLLTELTPILATDKKQSGTGTGNSGAGTGGGSTFVAANAKSRVEFTANAEKHLLASGKARSDSDWITELQKIVSENKDVYDSLPMRSE